MSRQRSFSEDEVRRSVLEAFWKTGFDGTSLSDLEEATELGRRSLYNSFGDKRALFLRALSDFRAQAVASNLSALCADDAAIEAIEATLDRLVKLAPTAQGRLGCLICNTAREPVAHDPDIAREVRAYFDKVVESFDCALVNAQKEGTFPAARSSNAAARFLLGVLVSICVLARAGASKQTLEAVKSEALRALS